VLLLEFLEKPWTIIPRSDLVKRLWPAKPQIGEGGLTVYVYRLNRILSNGSKQARYIQYVGGGYRLCTPVKMSTDAGQS
jgi:DNA-binding winged helix-turn-helix (wHTH) protein